MNKFYKMFIFLVIPVRRTFHLTIYFIAVFMVEGPVKMAGKDTERLWHIQEVFQITQSCEPDGAHFV